jgi:hypothetical protein
MPTPCSVGSAASLRDNSDGVTKYIPVSLMELAIR